MDVLVFLFSLLPPDKNSLHSLFDLHLFFFLSFSNSGEGELVREGLLLCGLLAFSTPSKTNAKAIIIQSFNLLCKNFTFSFCTINIIVIQMWRRSLRG